MALDPKILQERQALYRRVAPKLREVYGYPQWRQNLPPVDELVCTILSQNTSDINRDKGFAALKARYASWEDVRDAPVEDVRDTIRPAGLSNLKAPRIQEALRVLTEKHGEVTLDFLSEMSAHEGREWLVALNGIGLKTASIILLFAFQKPAFPVDTHVHRVSGRIGLIDPKTSADNAHAIMEAIVPPEDYYPFHLNLIQHGRELCQARKPKCELCPLTQDCHYYQELTVKKG